LAVEFPATETSRADEVEPVAPAPPEITDAVTADQARTTAVSPPLCLPALLRQRAAAAVIDAEVAVFSYLVAFAALMLADHSLGAALLSALTVTAVALVPAYYFAAFLFAGRTFGMALLKLYTGSPAGEEIISSTRGVRVRYEVVPLSLRAALTRALVGAASLVLFPVNMLFVRRHEEQLSLSDVLSETRVVYVPRRHE
jgi:hypothetical protein